MHFHGHFTTAAAALTEYRLAEQLVTSGRDAVLVVPQGPVRAPESSGGKLERPRGLERLHAEVTRLVAAELARPALVPGKVVLSAHSGGYQPAAGCLAHGGARVTDVILLDALYGFSSTFSRWVSGKPEGDLPRRRLVSFYAAAKVASWTQRLLGELRRGGVVVDQVGTDADVTDALLAKTRALLAKTRVPHGELPVRDDLLARLLRTSALGSV